MTNIALRPYQRDFIDAVRVQFANKNKRVVGVQPCGAGKTIMTGWMIRESLKRNKKSIFFVHRRELIKQTSETFTRLEIPHGIIDAQSPMQLDLPVQIASVQTLARRLDKIPAPDFLICDECHHILANTYKKILDAFPKAYLLGVTATPERMGGVTLADAFDSMVVGMTVNDLIQLGNLTKFKYYAPKVGIDLSGVRSNFGEYNQDDLAEVMSQAAIIGDIVNDYRNYADSLSAICYCVNVEHSKEVAQAFINAGISAAHCDGDTPTKQREQIVEDFRHGNIKILCNAELFGEGFDVPNMQAVILARPTKSLTLYIQQALRPLRPDPNNPNKVAVIIDHVQNYLIHGLPNMQHDWSLNPNDDKLKKCPQCGKMIKPVIRNGKRFCPECDYEFVKGTGESPPPRNRDTVDGDIIELQVNFADNQSDDDVVIKNKPTTIEEFITIAEKKKYKKAWAVYRAIEFAKSYKDFLHIANVCGYQKGWAYYHYKAFKETVEA